MCCFECVLCTDAEPNVEASFLHHHTLRGSLNVVKAVFACCTLFTQNYTWIVYSSVDSLDFQIFSKVCSTNNSRNTLQTKSSIRHSNTKNQCLHAENYVKQFIYTPQTSVKLIPTYTKLW